MSIYFDRNAKTFYLESYNLSYVFRVEKHGFLQHLYFGKRIPREALSVSQHYAVRGHATHHPDTERCECLDDLLMECPTYGRSDYRESMLNFDVDGVRVGDFYYVSHKIHKVKPTLEGMPALRDGETLQVTLKDDLHKLKVHLFYTVYPDLSAISRRAVVENVGRKAITIDRAYSFSLDLPDCKWETISLPGAHLRERHSERTPLKHGAFAVDSKHGVSSSQMNPFLALARKNTDENVGEAIGFNLIYSGNFVIKTHVDQSNTTRICGGLNDFDFAWRLEPKTTFSTPEAVIVYSSEGLGGMSRTFHDLYRNHLVNPNFALKPRPIVLNNWEATYFNFTEERLCKIIESAKDTGIDMFVLDDGWFGARNSEEAGLGDWFINYEKLPHGFKEVIDCCHRNGMKFGLWFEPEMAQRDSDLYRAHPDWIIHVDGLEPCLGRSQYVLDLTREEVRDYILSTMSAILEANEIDYVKWDMNRGLTDNYSATLGKRGKEFFHRYVLGLYDILERLTARFPNVMIEGCASGGCRFDPAILYYCPQIWTSDNSDAYTRTIIQYGTSYCYPLSAMSCHVSVCPNHQTGRVTPYSARTAIAHLGATGYELDPTKLSQEDFAQIKQDVADYREMEELVLKGDLYRLNETREDGLFAEEVISKDKSEAVITVMKPLFEANGVAVRIYPKGLDERATYCIRECDGKQLRGSTIMNAGIVLYMPWGDFQTQVLHLKKVK